MPIEIAMVGLGNHGTRPTLFIRTETEILIYRVSVKFNRLYYVQNDASHLNNKYQLSNRTILHVSLN